MEVSRDKMTRTKGANIERWFNRKEKSKLILEIASGGVSLARIVKIQTILIIQDAPKRLLTNKKLTTSNSQILEISSSNS